MMPSVFKQVCYDELKCAESKWEEKQKMVKKIFKKA